MKKVEKLKRTLNENMKVGSIFMDLSKDFDTLNHSLLLARLKAYGLESNTLKQMESYVTGCHQRTKVNNAHSPWSEVIQKYHKDHSWDHFFLILC